MLSSDWLLLPEPILENIMLMVGLRSLRDLDSCMRVCRTWNDVIRGKIWENPTMKWGTIIQRRLERSWDAPYAYPADKQISYAKCLGSYTIKILITYKFF